MIQAFKAHKSLFTTYAILLIVSTIALASMTKGDAVVFFNSWHSDLLDPILVSITRLGEYYGFFLVAIILLLRRNWNMFFAYLLTCLIMLGLVSLLKHIIFSDFMRPSVVLEKEHLHFVKGLHINRKFSFPSGHTTASFTYFIFLALNIKSNGWKFLLLALAVLVGFSRIYLAQHFLQDVIVGSVLGVLLATLGWAVIGKKWLKPLIK